MWALGLFGGEGEPDKHVKAYMGGALFGTAKPSGVPYALLETQPEPLEVNSIHTLNPKT